MCSFLLHIRTAQPSGQDVLWYVASVLTWHIPTPPILAYATHPLPFRQRDRRVKGLPEDTPENTHCFFAGLGYDARMLQDVGGGRAVRFALTYTVDVE